MNKKVGSVRNVKTINALRGDKLVIDLGKQFSGGVMTAWMRKDANSVTFRSFDIVDNRYLVLPQEKTKDYYNSENELVEAIAGKWYFDVEFLKDGDDATLSKTIYQGTINYVNDITGSPGYEITGDGTRFPEYTLNELTNDEFSLLKNGDIVSTISLSDYAKASDLFSGSYDDLTNKPTILSEQEVKDLMADYGYLETEIEAPKNFVDNRVSIAPFYEEDFSSGLGDFTTSGDSAWTVVSDEGNGDLFSARSGAIVDDNYTKMTINRTLSSETTLVKFDYKTSTENDFDFLMVTANGVRRKYSGETDWTTASFYVHGSGSQDISFTYVKDTGTTSGQDFVWIDNFSLTSDVEPFIFNSKVLFNEELNFKESVSFKEDVFFNDEISITGRSLSFLDENNEVTTSMSSVGQNSYLQASVNMVNSWAITANPERNRFQINKDNGSEGVKIQFDKNETLFPEGFMHIPVTAFQFRLGEFAGSDTDIIFVANGKGIFREKLKVEDAVESYGETSNKETLTSGIYNVDWKTLGNHDITLTENTTITETNIPQTGISKTITINVIGEFALILPVGWEVKNDGEYVGDVRTQIVVQSWDNGNYQTVIN